MYKFTFKCFNKGEANKPTKIIVMADNKKEAINELSMNPNKYGRWNYFSSDVKIEEVLNIKEVEKEINDISNCITKNNRIVLGMLIASYGSLIAGNQITFNDKKLSYSKTIKQLNINEIYDVSKSIIDISDSI